jgi:hypothetical protein
MHIGVEEGIAIAGRPCPVGEQGEFRRDALRIDVRLQPDTSRQPQSTQVFARRGVIPDARGRVIHDGSVSTHGKRRSARWS